MFATRIYRTVFTLGLLVSLPFPVQAILAPDAVYCTTMGYEYSVDQVPGGAVGMCGLPDGQRVNAADFVAGKVARDHSYCTRNGYVARYVEDSPLCKNCLVCVMLDGSEVEVTKLMDLNLLETSCGDNTCGIPENFITCPADCPSGGVDGLCDDVRDGIIDPDCDDGQDPDASPQIAGDVDGDGDVDRDDLNLVLAARNTPASGDDDPMDMDGDGTITANDARQLVLVCTRPRCATQ